jgi:hypothetical protein
MQQQHTRKQVAHVTGNVSRRELGGRVTEKLRVTLTDV